MAFRYTRVEKQIRKQLTAELATASEAQRGQIRKQLDDIATTARKRHDEKVRAREQAARPKREAFSTETEWLLALQEHAASQLLQGPKLTLRKFNDASRALKHARKRKAAMGIQEQQPRQEPRTPQTAVATDTDFAKLTNAELVAQFYKENFLPTLIGGIPDAERIRLVEHEIESRKIPLVKWTGSRFVNVRTNEVFADLSKAHLRVEEN